MAALLNKTKKKPVCADTVHNRLRLTGFIGRVARKKKTTKVGKSEERVAVGRNAQKQWIWNKVLWTDES